MTIEELHTQAMDMAEQADFLKMQGRADEANALYVKSFEAEKEAAYQAKDQKVGEPSESVLFRSAASLACQLNYYREAERLVCIGLSGNPPSSIAKELREVLQDIYSQSGNDDDDILIYNLEVPRREKNRFENFISQLGISASQVRRAIALL